MIFLKIRNLFLLLSSSMLLCRLCVPGLQGCGKKKGSNSLREKCLSYVNPVIVQVSRLDHYYTVFRGGRTWRRGLGSVVS